MTVCVVTHSKDVDTVSCVTSALERRDVPVFRLETDRFPTDVRLSLRYGNAGSELSVADTGRALRSAEIRAVWFRRFDGGAGIPTNLAPDMRHAALLEARAALFGWIHSVDAFHFDRVDRVLRAENKPLQLHLARELGLCVPETLITNDPVEARAFVERQPGGVVVKMLMPASIVHGGSQRTVFTSELRRDDLSYLQGLRVAPIVFQERIDKQRELRATIVGRRVFTASIDAARIEGAGLDWRRRPEEVMQAWEPASLPQDVEQALLRLTERLGLNYGAADLIVTPDGELVFLELNPGGQYRWLEEHTGLPISEAIADLLCDPASLRLS